MSEETVVSKVLVYESDESNASTLKSFFESHNLIGLKGNDNNLEEVLASNTDLGGVFLSDDSAMNDIKGLELVDRIHHQRPELPIFYRMADGQKTPEHHGIAGCYSLEDLAQLENLLDSHLFSAFYPIPLIRGIREISLDSFQAVIKNVEVSFDSPYLVKDQIIYGELFSLIPLESAWCRGFMMLQTTQKEVMNMISSNKTFLESDDVTFRKVNDILNEITNLIWGGIKSRFFSTEEHTEDISTRTHVPVLVNHKEKYISFGTNEPQLCFKYEIADPNNPECSIVLYQKMVFNLSWQPESFKECDRNTDELMDSGELELF